MVNNLLLFTHHENMRCEMVKSLTVQMHEASDPQTSYIELVKEAIRNIRSVEGLATRNNEDNHLLGEATANLLSGIRNLRAVDIAPLIKDFIADTPLHDLRHVILFSLNLHKEDMGATLDEKVIDVLAVASLYESIDEPTFTKLNVEAFYYLGAGQNNNLPMIVNTLEHLQIYYADEDREGEFTLSIQQMQDIDAITLKKAKEFLALPDEKKDPDIADRLSYLLENHEDEEARQPLIDQLTDYSEAHRVDDDENVMSAQRSLIEAARDFSLTF